MGACKQLWETTCDCAGNLEGADYTSAFTDANRAEAPYSLFCSADGHVQPDVSGIFKWEETVSKLNKERAKEE